MKEKHSSELRDSLSSRFMVLIAQNTAPRYLLYLLSVSLMVSTVLWQTPFASNFKTDGSIQNTQSKLHCATFASLAYPLFILGLSLTVLPALTGKAAVFRFIFGSSTWTMMSQMAFGMYFAVPTISVFYFMST